MTTPFIQVAPSKSAAIYTAALIIDKRGAMPRDELFARMDFGPAVTREKKLQQAFDTDWLGETQTGFISLTDYSKRILDRDKPKEEYVGQITPTTYRPNVFASPGLSAQHIPKRGGLRPASDLAPAWSVKPDGCSVKSAGGGGT
jgi:hypothetical protein